MRQTKSPQPAGQLIATYERRLHLLELKQAQLGISADPSIQMEIEEIQGKLERLHQPATGAPQVALRELATDTQRPPKYRGLIVLVGPGRADKEPANQSAGPAIAYHCSFAI